MAVGSGKRSRPSSHRAAGVNSIGPWSRRTPNRPPSPPSRPETEPAGCRIGRVNRPAADGPVTYPRDVVPVLQKRCLVCHREGEVAPFALTTYQQAAGWADMISEVLADGRMPPWHADPRFGKFANDRHLSAKERAEDLRFPVLRPVQR